MHFAFLEQIYVILYFCNRRSWRWGIRFRLYFFQIWSNFCRPSALPIHKIPFKYFKDKIFLCKVENILKGSLDSIPSPSHSNYGWESLLEAERQKINGRCQQTFENKKFGDIFQLFWHSVRKWQFSQLRDSIKNFAFWKTWIHNTVFIISSYYAAICYFIKIYILSR